MKITASSIILAMCFGLFGGLLLSILANLNAFETLVIIHVQWIWALLLFMELEE